MGEVLEGFETNLKKQISCYRNIVQLEKEKQQALVENKIQEIEAITAQEEKILLEVSRLEEERLHWAEFFGNKIGKKVEEITLGELVAVFPSLEQIRTELEKEFSTLKDLHEVNTKLLENAVNIVNFTIQSLALERQTTYGNPGEKSGKKELNINKSTFFDKSI